MKKLEIIIPHERLNEADSILEKFNVGGMSFLHVNGRGKTKWGPIPVGRGVMVYTPKFGTRTTCQISWLRAYYYKNRRSGITKQSNL